MKKINLLTWLLCVIFLGCNEIDLRPIGLRFTWFKNTPVWPLAKAVRDEDTALIRFLVQQKHMDVNYQEKSKWGSTLLHLAVGNELVASTAALLENGARTDIWDSLGNRPINAALMNNLTISWHSKKLQILELLLKHGADPNGYKWYKYGDSSRYKIAWVPLQCGVENLDFARILLEYGARMDLKYYDKVNDFDSIPVYPAWESVALNTAVTERNGIYVMKYLIMDLHLPVPDTISFYGDNSRPIKDCKPYRLLELLNKTNFKDEEKQKAKEEILQYLKRIGFPKRGALPFL